jgi:hypothetical protein
MTTQTLTAASSTATSSVPAALLLDDDGRRLVAEVERYLAARRRTAHPLVSLTTEELVRAALGTGPAAPAEDVAALPLPGGIWRHLPDWTLAAWRPATPATGLVLTTAQHLELTALALLRYGWTGTGAPAHRQRGPRCILGAQTLLYRLGYGSADTVTAAGIHLNALLRERGISSPYFLWNDQPGTTRDQALALVRAAAVAARR